jgi:hypothetical protein
MVREEPRQTDTTRTTAHPGKIFMIHRVASFRESLQRAIDTGTRALALKMAVCFGCIAGLLLSSKLWLTSRSYPLVPVFEKLPVIRGPIDYLLLATLALLLALIAFSSRSIKFILAFLVLAVYLCLVDQSRLQPWFYQYCVLLAACAVYRENKTKLLNTASLLIATVYFWSGVQKIGVGFVDRVFPTVINPYLNTLFGRPTTLPRPLIAALPLLEVLIGIGLLIRRFRNIAVVLAVFMHLAILLVLIPLKLNSVIWPWNVAMVVVVAALFWRRHDVSLSDLLVPREARFQLIVLILFGALPLLSFFNLWDSYLSASLYSGDFPVAVIRFNDRVKERLPPGVQDYVENGNGEWSINPMRWSLRELNAPAYPEPRVFKRIGKSVCAVAEDPSDVRLTIYSKPYRLTGERVATTYPCGEL